MSARKILIIGAGEVAVNLAINLIGSNKNPHFRLDVELFFIEKDKSIVDRFNTQIDGRFYEGDGTDPELLLTLIEEHDFDFVIALTNNDHANLIACLMAKKIAAEIGKPVPKTIARHKNIYFDKENQSGKTCNILDYFQIDHVIYLEKAWAEATFNTIMYPQLKSIKSIYHDQIYLVCIEVDAKNPLANRVLTEFRTEERLTIAAIKSKDSDTLKLPKSNEKIEIGDQVFLFLPKEKIKVAFEQLKLGLHTHPETIIVADQFQMVQNLIKRLIQQKIKTFSVMPNEELAQKLEKEFGGHYFTSISGNPLTDDLVNPEITSETILITASDNDAMNISIGFKAKKKNPLATFVVTKHDEHDYHEMTKILEIKHLESPKEIIVKRLIEYLHIEMRDQNFYFLLDDQNIESDSNLELRLMIKEFRIEELSNLAGTTLREIKDKGFPDLAVICLIRRNDEYIMPSSHTELKVNDHLMIAGIGKDLKFEESLGLISEIFKSSDEIEHIQHQHKEKKKKKLFWII
jgi:Trk K+ transport system NAD-binding subunit